MNKKSDIPNKASNNSANPSNIYGCRVQQLRDFLDLKQNKFAKMLKMSPSYLSEIEAGKRKPGHQFLQRIIKAFSVNVNWLITGDGNMFTKPENEFKHEYNFGKHHEEFSKVLSLCELSPLFLLSLLTYAHSYYWQFENTIKKDIKRNKQLEGKKEKPNTISLNLDNFSLFSQEDE